MTLQGQICSRELTSQDKGPQAEFGYHKSTTLTAGGVPPSSTSLLDADFPDAPLDRPMSRVYYCALSGAPRSPGRIVPTPPVSADATLIADLSRRGRLHGRTDIGANMIPRNYLIRISRRFVRFGCAHRRAARNVWLWALRGFICVCVSPAAMSGVVIPHPCGTPEPTPPSRIQSFVPWSPARTGAGAIPMRHSSRVSAGATN